MTAHWRNFIHPLMWRCKWTELRIKELESQASKYPREISVYDSRKHMALDQITGEQSGSRLMPFTHQSRRKEPMKRMKRKRVEDTTDIASYMSNHILFSERGLVSSLILYCSRVFCSFLTEEQLNLCHILQKIRDLIWM